jgi:hypothetical protein
MEQLFHQLTESCYSIKSASLTRIENAHFQESGNGYFRRIQVFLYPIFGHRARPLDARGRGLALGDVQTSSVMYQRLRSVARAVIYRTTIGTPLGKHVHLSPDLFRERSRAQICMILYSRAPTRTFQSSNVFCRRPCHLTTLNDMACDN